MPTKFPVERAEQLLSASRPGAVDPNQVIAALPLRPWQDIADIGCGPGYFTVPLAKYAYDGKVYAVDMQQGMLDLVEEQVRKINLSNVVTVLSKETKIPLEDDAVDGAFLSNVLHEATSPTRLLKEAVRIVKPRGWIAVMEWRKQEMEIGPPIEERIDMADAVKLLEKQDLDIRATREIGDTRYLIITSRR